MTLRVCKSRKTDGEPCGSPPLQDGKYCLWHDPDHADEVAEARRLGGLRRRRETAVTGAFDLGGLASVGGIRRLLEVAVVDTLSLEGSISRARTLAYLAQTAARLLETGDLEQRIQHLESLLEERPSAIGRRPR